MPLRVHAPHPHMPRASRWMLSLLIVVAGGALLFGFGLLSLMLGR